MSTPTENSSIPPPHYIEDDDISLKELYLKALELVNFIRRHIKQLVLLGLMGGVIGFTYAHFTKKTQYASKLTFAVEEKEGSGLSGLASQFGFDMGGGASLFTTDNLLQLLKSDRIVQASLLKPQKDLPQASLYNLYLESRFKEQIAEGEISLIDPDLNREAFTREQDSILQKITLTIGEKIEIGKKDKNSSLITVTVTDIDEDFAWRFSKELIKEAADLYLELKVGKMKRSIQLLKTRQDSVQIELKSAMLDVAAETDRSQSIQQLVPKVNAARKQLQVTLLTTLYAEITKNLELSKYTMEREEPSIEVIDEPRKPLEIIGRGRVKAAILTGFVFGLLTLATLFVKEKLQD